MRHAMSTDITVLDHLAVVNLDIHIWSARKKLLPPDLGGAELPPEDLASLGSKRICNPEDLKTFGTLKARAVSLLERNGIRFLGGWAVPETSLDVISEELSAIRKDFNQARDDFLQRYDTSVQEWIAVHPQWKDMIANSTVSEEYARSRLNFRWQTFRVLPPSGNATDHLQEDVGNLDMILFDEIAKTATDAWNHCYAGKSEITRKALSPLKAIHDKLHGLTFVEPRIAPITDLIRQAFTWIPKRGAINGGTLLMLQGMVSLLRHPSEFLEHGRKLLEGQQGTQDILEGFLNDPVLLINDITRESSAECREEPQFVTSIPPVLDSQGLW
jgi:hypothetical protein